MRQLLYDHLFHCYRCKWSAEDLDWRFAVWYYTIQIEALCWYLDRPNGRHDRRCPPPNDW